MTNHQLLTLEDTLRELANGNPSDAADSLRIAALDFEIRTDPESRAVCALLETCATLLEGF